MPAITCIWNPDSLRASLFAEAMARFDGSTPAVLTWSDFLSSRHLPVMAPVVRVDSPGRNWSVEKALLALGAVAPDEHDPEGRCWTNLDAAEVACLGEDKGRVLGSRQWYRGFRIALARLQDHCRDGDGNEVRWIQHPAEIAVMFDKAACGERFHAAGCRTPRPLGVVQGFDDLMAHMEREKVRRVFVKLCHGSSASGAVALEMSGTRLQAFSTARLSRVHGVVQLHNDRQVQRYTSREDIGLLVDAVCRERAWAEAWMPKAGWQGKRFDVRVIVIRGRARHVVARLADGPFTNLQLGARRAGAEALRQHVGDAAFTSMCDEAERAMGCFPRSLHGGVDILLESPGHRACVLEVNAFGDLLPGCLHEGRDVYTWELEVMR